MVRYSKNEWFYGRDELLSQLSLKLQENKAHHRVAIYGLGGFRRTQTALAYVYMKCEFYRSIFRVSGINEMSDFQRIAKCVGIVISDAEECAVPVLAWLNLQASWLLVIDNLDKIEIINGFLPNNDVKKHTLITTRKPNADGILAEVWKSTF